MNPFPQSTRFRNAARPRRRSFALAVVLFSLAALTIMFAGLLRSAVDRHGQIVNEERRLQATWLVNSGLERAAVRLRAAGDYAGEMWKLEPEAMQGRHAALVTIRVEPVADRPQARRVSVTADYPAGSEHRARQTREVIVEIQKE